MFKVWYNSQKIIPALIQAVPGVKVEPGIKLEPGVKQEPGVNVDPGNGNEDAEQAEENFIVVM